FIELARNPKPVNFTLIAKTFFGCLLNGRFNFVAPPRFFDNLITDAIEAVQEMQSLISVDAENVAHIRLSNSRSRQQTFRRYVLICRCPVHSPTHCFHCI
ncbi:hypothetical protein PFISCL1PPCAC_22340, partial [Pristionchus fissidentatus]